MSKRITRSSSREARAVPELSGNAIPRQGQDMTSVQDLSHGKTARELARARTMPFSPILGRTSLAGTPQGSLQGNVSGETTSSLPAVPLRRSIGGEIRRQEITENRSPQAIISPSNLSQSGNRRGSIGALGPRPEGERASTTVSRVASPAATSQAKPFQFRSPTNQVSDFVLGLRQQIMDREESFRTGAVAGQAAGPRARSPAPVQATGAFEEMHRRLSAAEKERDELLQRKLVWETTSQRNSEQIQQLQEQLQQSSAEQVGAARLTAALPY